MRGAVAGDDDAARSDDLLLERTRRLPAGIHRRRRGAASAAAKPGGARADPAFRADSPSPARRPASSVARSLTSRAPTPGGPPSLCAQTAMKSASGSGILPAPCAQSASSSEPASRIALAMRSSGWITPVSLFTCWIATSAGPSARMSSRARSVDQPILADRQMTSIRRPSHGGTMAMLGRAMGSPGNPRPARHNLDGLARPGGEDDVMTPAERIRDRRALACSSADLRLVRRHVASWDWPRISSARVTASRASGRTGVVAAWSR